MRSVDAPRLLQNRLSPSRELSVCYEDSKRKDGGYHRPEQSKENAVTSQIAAERAARWVSRGATSVICELAIVALHAETAEDVVEPVLAAHCRHLGSER